MNRKISLTILLVFFVVSCAKAEIPPTPTSTPNPTFTPPYTKTPEASPTATLTPTPEEPKAGDVRMEKGVQQVYEVIKDKEGNIMYAEWVRVKTPGDGIPILDWGISQYVGNSKSGNIQLVCSDSYDKCVDVPKFTHIDKLPENNNDIDVTSATNNPLAERFYKENPTEGDVAITPILMDYPQGFDLHFFLKDPEHLFTWRIRPGHESSAVTILTDWNDPLLEGGQEIGIDSYFTLKVKILGVDNTNRLIGIVALNNFPPEGAEYIWSSAIYLPSSMVIQTDDVLSLNSRNVDLIRDIVYRAGRPSSAGKPWMIIAPDK